MKIPRHHVALNAGLCALLLLAGCAPTTSAPDALAPDQLRATLADYQARLGDPAAASDGTREAALRYLEKVLADQPACFPARFQRACWLLDWGREEEALADFAEIERRYGAQPDCTALSGLALYRMGHKRAAADRFASALSLDPRNETALFHTGLLLAENGHGSEAEKYLSRVRALNSANAAAGEWLEALKISRDPAAVAGIKAGADALLAKRVGTLLVRNGQYAEGSRLLAITVAARPDDVEAARTAAHAMTRSGKSAQAMALLTRAVELAPRDADAWMDLGSCHLQRGRRRPSSLIAARDCFLRAAALTPKEIAPLQAAAKASVRIGDLLGAMKYYDQALKTDPERADFYLDYGLFLARHKQLAAAEELYRKAATRFPDDARIQANLMTVLFEVGRFEEAGRLREALGRRKDLPENVRSLLASYGGGAK